MSKLSENDLEEIGNYFHLTNNLKLLTGVGFADYRVNQEYVENLPENMLIFVYNEINIKIMTNLKENLLILSK